MNPRLDIALVERGMARSRQHAQQLIRSGAVEVGSIVIRRVAAPVTAEVALVVRPTGDGPDYVSRAGQKLADALDLWEVEITGKRCLDVGASTGGFTDVLLRRGAASVVAVDVGHGQFDSKLAADPRVDLREGVNARDLVAGAVVPEPHLVVADLSFISLRMVFPPLLQVAPHADLVVLVKPQFEVGRTKLGASGVVRDPLARREAVASVVSTATELGLGLVGLMASTVVGRSGNQEYLAWFSQQSGRSDLLEQVFEAEK